MAYSLEAVSLDKLKSFLECSICLNTVTSPRTLPCFHSYCQPCLENFVKNERYEKAMLGRPVTQFNCPTCRSPFTLNRDDEVATMTTNHFISSMLDVKAVDQHRVKGVPCSHCKKSSVGRCENCDVFLCCECRSVHDSYLGHKGHLVIAMEELSRPENQGKVRRKLHCISHTKKKLKFYCETCEELICRYCMDFDHAKRAHSCSPVENVAQKEKELLIANCSSLKEQLSQGKVELGEINNVKRSFKIAKDKVRQDINRRQNDILKEITEKIKKKGRDLINEFDALCDAELNVVDGQENEIKSLVEALESYVNLSQGLLLRGTDEEILSSVKNMRINATKFKEKCFPKEGRPSMANVKYRSLPIDSSTISLVVEQMGNVCQERKLSKFYPDVKQSSSFAHFIQTIYKQDIERFKIQYYVDVVFSDEKERFILKPMRGFKQSEMAEAERKIQQLYETTSKKLKIKTLDLTKYSNEEIEKIKKLMTKQRLDVLVEETSYDVFALVGEAGNVELFCKNVFGAIERETTSSETKSLVDNTPLVVNRKGVRVVLMMGEIEKQDCDGIVNFTDNELVHKTGLPYAIREAAGEEFWKECRSIIAKNGALPDNMVTITKAGLLPCKVVLHAVLAASSKERRQDATRFKLEHICRLLLTKAKETKLKSLCFPIINPDIANLPTAVSARLLFNVIKTFIETGSTLEGGNLEEIRIVYRENSKDAEDYKKEFNSQF